MDWGMIVFFVLLALSIGAIVGVSFAVWIRVKRRVGADTTQVLKPLEPGAGPEPASAPTETEKGQPS